VTLEVTPEQSEVLNLASAQGKIHLSLRNRTNKAIAPTAGIATSGLISGGNAAQCG
jgi:Flp pilus assembly protein CpaB